MDTFDTTVDTQPQSAPVDAAQAVLAETTEATALTEVLSGMESSAAETQQGSQPKDRAENNLAARYRAENAKLLARLDALEARYADMTVGSEADKLVADGEFKSRDRAVEYLKLKNGTPPETERQERPRDGQGRFVGAQEAEGDGLKQRAQMLFEQAQAIQQSGGPDMMALYKSNSSVRDAVLRGVDFDVIHSLLGANPAAGPDHPAQGRQQVPAPVRSPNNPNPGARDFLSMTDAEFKAFKARLAQGEKFDTRR